MTVTVAVIVLVSARSGRRTGVKKFGMRCISVFNVLDVRVGLKIIKVRELLERRIRSKFEHVSLTPTSAPTTTPSIKSTPTVTQTTTTTTIITPPNQTTDTLRTPLRPRPSLDYGMYRPPKNKGGNTIEKYLSTNSLC